MHCLEQIRCLNSANSIDRCHVTTGGRATGSADQAAVIAFLADPSTYAGVDTVERLETHGNLVFLAGEDAWKIKRAVRFPYMDFSTLERRRAACAREVEVNRRLAPDIYLGCVAITRARPAGASHSAATARSSNGRCTCAASSSRRC